MRILDSEVKLKVNIVYSLKRYSVWWVILLVTIVFDLLTTLYFVEKHGVAREANLVVRWLIQNFSLPLGILAGKTLQLLSVVIMVGLHRRLGNLFMLVVILLNSWAVVMNSLI